MIYVLDNNIISMIIRNLPYKVFKEDIYDSMQKLIDEGRLISTDEVFEELSFRWNEKIEEFVWFKLRRKLVFLKMTNQECGILMDIYSNNKFREGVKESSILIGSPEADAMIVAKAKAICGTVVTNEKDKPNSEKIPQICKQLAVSYINYENFLLLLKNISKKASELESVTVNK